MPKVPQAQFGPRTVNEYIHRPEFELYDMLTDPYESKNLALDLAYSDEVANYKEKLKGQSDSYLGSVVFEMAV